jgi:hypothetical protein
MLSQISSLKCYVGGYLSGGTSNGPDLGTPKLVECGSLEYCVVNIIIRSESYLELFIVLFKIRKWKLN